MDVTQAVMKRRSIRSYLRKPVSKKTVEEILDKARWSPSGTNTQPWFIEVVSGESVVKLGDVLAEAGRIDPNGRPTIPYDLTQVDSERQQFRRTLGSALYAAKGIAREDREKRASWYQHNLRFFGAPVALIIHTFESYMPYAWQDTGIMAQSIMLLAEERGLGTCVEYSPLHYPDIVKDFLHIPGDHILALAIALGYPELDDPVNNFPREREPVSKFVRFIE